MMIKGDDAETLAGQGAFPSFSIKLTAQILNMWNVLFTHEYQTSHLLLLH